MLTIAKAGDQRLQNDEFKLISRRKWLGLATAAVVACLPQPAEAAAPLPQVRATIGEFSKSHFDGMVIRPDGQAIAAASNGRIQIFDVAKRKVLREFEAHRGGETSLCFSPDNKQLASGVAEEKSVIRLWDAATFAKSQEIAVANCSCLSFSADGKFLATQVLQGEAAVWNAETAQKLISLGEGSHRAVQLSLGPDGKTLASLSYRGVAIWAVDGAKGERLQMLITSTGKDTLTPSAGKQLRPAPARVPKINSTMTIHSIAMSDDGKLLALGGTEKNVNHVELYDMNKKTNTRIFSDSKPVSETSSIRRMLFTPNGNAILVQTLMKFSCINSSNGKAIFEVAEPKREVPIGPGERKLFHPFQHLDLSRDGKTLVTAGTNTQIRVWDMPANLQ